MTRSHGISSCAAVLRDASRRITHELNNAANGVAVNLEVVRVRTAAADTPNSTAPFAERAAEQLEALTALQEILRSLLQLTIESVDEDRLSCRLSPGGDAFEITFPGAFIPHGLRAGHGEASPISMRNSPQGVILSVPRAFPGGE